jgi:hypothetical protein
MNNLEILSAIPEGLEFNTLNGSQPKASASGSILFVLVILIMGVLMYYKLHSHSHEEES